MPVTAKRTASLSLEERNSGEIGLNGCAESLDRGCHRRSARQRAVRPRLLSTLKMIAYGSPFVRLPNRLTLGRVLV
jgi:hypothetical protein